MIPLLRWWNLMRRTPCETAARRLKRAAALHRLTDAGVKRAALDQVDRTEEVRTALAALLAQMDRRPTRDGDPHAADPA